jgi:hypothetical protein
MSRKTEVALRDRGAVSGLLTGLSFVAGVGGGSALADSPYPRPGSEPAEVRRYFTENVRSARLSATGQLVSSASLARFTASVARLAGRSGKGSEGLRKAALAGGALAAASLATSGLHTLASAAGGAGTARARPGWPKGASSSAARPRRRLRGAHRRPGAGRTAHRRAAPPRGDRWACLGGLGASLAAVLPRRAGGRIDTGGAVLGAGGMRDRRGAAWPPLAPGDALPRRGSRPVSSSRAGRSGGAILRRHDGARGLLDADGRDPAKSGDPRPVLSKATR